MSAYISILTAAGGYLFTDGAAYDEAGVVQQIVRKVETSTAAPFAITTLGNSVIGTKLKSGLIEMVDRFGVDLMLEEALPAFLANMRGQDEWNASIRGKGNTAAHMVAHSPTRGLVHFNFQTMDEPETDIGKGAEAYRLNILETPFTGRGSVFDPNGMTSVRPPSPDETIDDYMRYFGVLIMEKMRAEKGLSMHLKGTGVPPRHLIGGHIDMTVVAANGVRTERIHVWDDKIGRMIRPAASAGTVTPFSGQNRQQRRAAERAQRKTA